jgi:hypothetical protein
MAFLGWSMSGLLVVMLALAAATPERTAAAHCMQTASATYRR